MHLTFVAVYGTASSMRVRDGLGRICALIDQMWNRFQAIVSLGDPDFLPEIRKFNQLVFGTKKNAPWPGADRDEVRKGKGRAGPD